MSLEIRDPSEGENVLEEYENICEHIRKGYADGSLSYGECCDIENKAWAKVEGVVQ